MHRADDIVELRHAGFFDGPAVLGRPQALVLRRQMCDHVHTRGVEPDEERLARCFRLVDKFERLVADHLVDRFHVVFDAGHRMRRQRPFVDDLLLADLAPAGLHGRIVLIARHTVQQVARADFVEERRRVIGVERILHRIEVIEIARRTRRSRARSGGTRCGRPGGSCRIGRWRSPWPSARSRWSAPARACRRWRRPGRPSSARSGSVVHR